MNTTTTQSNIWAFLLGVTAASSIFAVVLCVVLTSHSTALRREYERGISTGERQQAFTDKVLDLK